MCKKLTHSQEEGFRIYPLSPVIEKEDGSTDSEYIEYKGFLDSALNNPDVRNVAVTGNFGIGKSRFLHYYAKGKKYLFVSGCSFFEHEDANENSVEYNLLYQLLLGCRQSREWQRRIQKVCFLLTPLFLLGTVFFLTLAPTLGTYLRELTIPGLNWPLYKATLSYWLHVLVYGLTFVLLAADAVFLMRSSSLKLKSISLKLGGVEMAVEKAKEESPLYKNRDMLIQALVESANKIDRTVIFEDMDRLGESCCIDLFTKLWELNKLVNLCMKKDKPIRFIYVIHDALFALASAKKRTATGERESSLEGVGGAGGAVKPTEGADGRGETARSKEKNEEREQTQPSPDAYVQLKFFDYILPILPSMSEKDAIVAVNNLLRDAGQNAQNELDDLIAPLAPYLSDYRLLRNIVNEYSVFDRILLARELKYDKPVKYDKKTLFAFAIYKNLMPQDYKRLREKNSIVFPNSQEKAQDKSLPESIQLLIQNHWLDDTCLHYVGYDRKGLKECIESAFGSGNDTASIKKFWLENEPDLCFEVMASLSQLKRGIEGIELSLAAHALKNEKALNIVKTLLKPKESASAKGAVAPTGDHEQDGTSNFVAELSSEGEASLPADEDTARNLSEGSCTPPTSTIEPCCIEECSDELLKKIHAGLGLNGETSVFEIEDQRCVVKFLLLLGYPDFWKLVPGSNRIVGSNQKVWWKLVRGLDADCIQKLNMCCKDRNGTNHLINWATQKDNCWVCDNEGDLFIWLSNETKE